MKKNILKLFVLAFGLFPATILAQQSSTDIQIIPAPQKITRSQGQFIFLYTFCRSNTRNYSFKRSSCPVPSPCA